MSYALPSDFLARYDSRVAGDLVNDQNIRVDPTSLLTNANLQAALDDASGMVNSAVLVAQKYAVTDLEQLEGVDKALLIRLVCNLAYGFLAIRRGLPTEKIEQYQEALDYLALIRSGERVFAVVANEEAGNPSASFPSLVDYSHLQLIRDVDKVFPVRRNQQVV